MATPKKWYESIICISDLQCPFQHIDAFEFLSAIKKKYYLPPTKKGLVRTKCVNQGDEVDFHNWGKWPTDPNGHGPSEEYTLAVKALALLWNLFPEQDVCISNHTIRPLKKAFLAGLPRVFLKDYAEFLSAPQSVRWRDTWEYNDIIFEHGEGVSGQTAALRKALDNRKSTSIGHQHSWGGVIYAGSRYNCIWGMNTGCLINFKSYAFAYGKANAVKGTLGCGVILDNIPHFIPLITNKAGRWIGRIP